MVSLLDDERRKPHFRFKAGVWSCSTCRMGRMCIGFGYTVREAWSDWWRHAP
jgi:ribosomal protein L37AE/L43A